MKGESSVQRVNFIAGGCEQDRRVLLREKLTFRESVIAAYGSTYVEQNRACASSDTTVSEPLMLDRWHSSLKASRHCENMSAERGNRLAACQTTRRNVQPSSCVPRD